MKKGNVFAAVIVVLGVLIAVLPYWGPAAVCPLPEGGRWMKCHWMGMAELGIGALVTGLHGKFKIIGQIGLRLRQVFLPPST